MMNAAFWITDITVSIGGLMGMGFFLKREMRKMDDESWKVKVIEVD